MVVIAAFALVSLLFLFAEFSFGYFLGSSLHDGARLSLAKSFLGPQL